MQRKLILTMLTSVATLACWASVSAAYAADISIKPGLWEVSTSSDLLAFAEQIPPEQMNSINALAKEYGFEVPEIKNGAAKSMTCVTPEMAKQKILPGAVHNQAGCTINKVTQKGNYYHMTYTCVNEQVNGNGTVEGNFSTAESFSGVTNFNGTIQNNAVNEQAKIDGKWLANSCESLNSKK